MALYKAEKRYEASEYVDELDNYHVPDYISGTKDKIYGVVNWSIINIRMCNTRKSIDYHFNVFKSSLVSYYLEISRDYAKYNNIDFNYFSDKINLECRAVEFYEQLEKIKKQYESEANERLNRLRNMLIKETEKYKKHIGYSHLKDFISKIIEETILGIGNDDWAIGICVSNMHTCITEKFEKFFEDKLKISAEKYKFYAGYNEFVKKRIHNKIDLYTPYAKDIDFDESKLKDFTNKFQDEIESIFDRNFAIINKLNKLKNIFNSNSDYLEVDSFHSLYAELEILEQNFNNGDDITTNLDGIESKLEKLLQIYKNKELLNKTYYILITNYHNKLASMNPLDYKKIQRVNEIFGEAIKMFAKLEWQDISLDTAADVFSRITFNNYDEDMSLIKNSIKSGVYIQNPDLGYFYNNPFFYFKEDDGVYSMYMVLEGVTKHEISVDKFKNGYISLEDFLQNAEYIGKEEQITNELKALVLYKFKNMYIIRYEGIESIDLFILSRRTKGELKAISDYSMYGGDYKDKDELIRAIKNDVERRVLFYENNKRSEVEEEKVFRRF